MCKTRSRAGFFLSLRITLFGWIIKIQAHISYLAFACVLIAVIIAPKSVYADWQNLTGAETAPNIAEIVITEKRIHIALEIYIENTEKFLAEDRAIYAYGETSLPHH